MPDKRQHPHNRKIIATKDGSVTVYVDEMNETYHSMGGAMEESKYVYIEHGFKRVKPYPKSILEIGMGTGLNVLLTMQEVNFPVEYDSLEPFPLSAEEVELLNYAGMLNIPENIISEVHQFNGEYRKLTPNFKLRVFELKLEDFIPDKKYDLVYFDAFAPSKQQKPWSFSNLEKLFNTMNEGGLLTTYCAQGQFKRDLKSIGFKVENPEGALGKREMTLAWKA